MERNKEQVLGHSSWLSRCSNWRSLSKSLSDVPLDEKEDHHNDYDDEKRVVTTVSSNERKPGGWKSMPFILGLFLDISFLPILHLNFLIYEHPTGQLCRVLSTPMTKAYLNIKISLLFKSNFLLK